MQKGSQMPNSFPHLEMCIRAWRWLTVSEDVSKVGEIPPKTVTGGKKRWKSQGQWVSKTRAGVCRCVQMPEEG